MLDQITPLVLTFNEAPNIGRTLEKVRWAREVIVLDSFSSDETLELVSTFLNARIVQREFDSHAAQWNFGLSETGISSAWVLALDADYLLTDDFVAELKSLSPASDIAGYDVHFSYHLSGRPLRSGIYPPVTLLFRRDKASFVQDGHTHRVCFDGKVDRFQSKILHDDRKPLSRWFASQQRYMALEAEKIARARAGKLNLADRIRRLRLVAPVAVLFYCLIMRGGVLDGWRGFYYAFQRVTAELLLSLYLLEHDFSRATETQRHSELTSEGNPRKVVES